MKIQTILAVLALAGGTAFAAPNDTAKAPATPETATAAAANTSATATRKEVHKMTVAKKHHAKHHARHHAKHHKVAAHHAKRHHVAAHHARHHHVARHHGHATTVMGAPATTESASARQHRMDAAYADWKAKQGR